MTSDLIKDWPKCFSELHLQFNWPLPSSKQYQIGRKDSRRTSTAGSKLKGAVQRKEDEIRHLLNACMIGGFYSLSLLLATMLCDRISAVQIVTKCPDYLTLLEGSLGEVNCIAYNLFLSDLKTAV